MAAKKSQAQGDSVGGDKIVVGDISGSVAAIGAGAQVIYNTIERSLTDVEISELTEESERNKLVEAVMAYVERLQRQAEQANDQPSTGNPYKALLEYDIDDAALFYGRSAATTALMERLQRDQLTVIHADSGAGKTSLIKAGVMPRLLANGALPIYVRPYNTPAHYALKRALLPSLELTPNLAVSSLHEFVRGVTDMLGGTQVVVIFDQFEEIFSAQSAAARADFVSELAPCLEDGSLPVRWIFAMRGEWLSQLGTFRPQIRNPFANEFLLSALSKEEAAEVIIEPAARRNVTYEAGLVDTILADLGEGTVSPPQLQLVCYGLFDSLADTTVVSNTMYEELGGVRGILRSHLDRVLTRDVTPEQRPVARRVLQALVSSEGRRIVRPRDDLSAELQTQEVDVSMLDAVLEQMLVSRLLRITQMNDEDSTSGYELAHNYLLDQIELDPATQARKAAQELVENSLEDYQRYGTLISANELVIIEPQLENIILSDEQSDLIDLSERRLLRQRRVLVAGAGVVIAMLVLAVFSLITASGATIAKQNAERAQSTAVLAAADAATREAQSMVAAQEAQSLAVEAEARVEAASGQLGRLFEETGTVPVGNGSAALAWDGNLVWVANYDDNTIESIDPATGVVLGVISVEAGPTALAWHAGTQTLWVANHDNGTIQKIDAANENIIATLQVGRGPYALASIGNFVWVANRAENTVQKVDAASLDIVATVGVGTGPNALAWDETLDVLWVVTGTDGTLSKIDPDTVTIIETFAIGPTSQGLVFDGTNLWVAHTHDDSLHKVDPSTGEFLATVPITSSATTTISAGAGPSAVYWDGNNLWVAVADGTLRQINSENGVEVGLVAAGAGPSAIAFDGTSLWVANRDEKTVQRVNPDSAQVSALRATIPVGSSPRGLIWNAATAELWIANSSDNSLSRIDQAAQQVTETYAVGAYPRALVIQGDTLWVATENDNTIQRLDLATGEVLQTIEMPPGPRAMEWDGQNLWVAGGFGEGTLTLINGTDFTQVASFVVGAYPRDMQWDGEHLWVSNEDDDVIIEIDINTRQIITTVEVGNGPDGFAYDADNNRLWVANSGDNTVQQIDPETLEIVATINVGAGPRALAWDGQNLWVANAGDNTVQMIDVTENQVRATIPVGAGPRSLVWDGESIWVGNFNDSTVRKIDPEVVRIVAAQSE